MRRKPCASGRTVGAEAGVDGQSSATRKTTHSPRTTIALGLRAIVNHHLNSKSARGTLLTSPPTNRVAVRPGETGCAGGLSREGETCVSRPKQIAASYHGTTQHDADPSDGIPRRAVRRCTTWDSISVRCGIKRGEGTVPKKSLREAKQPCPRPSAAVRGGETRVSRALSGTPQLY